MNIECDQAALDELESSFRFNDAVLRSLTIRRDEAITEASHLAKSGSGEAEVERSDEDEESVEGEKPVAETAEAEA
jgi:small subunit ribosomal protein S6